MLSEIIPKVDGSRAVALVLLITAIVSLRQAASIRELGDGLNPVADPYSEADTVRGGEGFAKNGFWSNSGLPDVVYGERFARHGNKKDVHEPSYVYTHYPPGPYWLAGVMTLICGEGRLGCFRALPLAVGLPAAAYFGVTLVRVLGPLAGLGLYLLLTLIPMFTNMMNGLHYQGYAHALHLVQISLILRSFLLPGSNVRAPAIVGALAFVQGWLSFDYAFIVVFTAVPLAYFAAARREVASSPLRAAFPFVLSAGLGFTLAHVLHFGQVVAHLGDLRAAVADFTTAAVRRFDNSVQTVNWIRPKDIRPLSLVWRYLNWYAGLPDFFGVTLAPFFLAAVFTYRVDRLKVRLGRKGAKAMIWSAPKKDKQAVFAALLVSLLWVLVMRQHSAIHTHFIPRHLFLFFFVFMMSLVLSVRVEKANVP